MPTVQEFFWVRIVASVPPPTMDFGTVWADEVTTLKKATIHTKNEQITKMRVRMAPTLLRCTRTGQTLPLVHEFHPRIVAVLGRARIFRFGYRNFGLKVPVRNLFSHLNFLPRNRLIYCQYDAILSQNLAKENAYR